MTEPIIHRRCGMVLFMLTVITFCELLREKIIVDDNDDKHSLVSDLLLYEKKIYDDNDDKHLLSKVSEVSSSSSSLSSSPCTGTAKERRLLAKKGGSAEEWRQMAICMMKWNGEYLEHDKEEETSGINQQLQRQDKKTAGQFLLHVSKAGGTSLCDTMKQQQCYKGNGNCHIDNNFINTFGGWVSPAAEKEFRIGKWVEVKKTPDNTNPNCSQIAHYAQNTTTKLVALERHVPPNMLQDHFNNYFMTTMAVREPMKRIQSHYKHIFRLAKNRKQFFGNNANYENNPTFNISYLSERFELVTDNHYTRILNGIETVLLPFGHITQNVTLYKNAKTILQNFDWILLVDRETISNEAQDVETQLILHQGLGLTNVDTIKHSNSNKKVNLFSFSREDMEYLKKVNKFDYLLWKDAKQLHDLDTWSLGNLTKYASDVLQGRTSRNSGNSNYYDPENSILAGKGSDTSSRNMEKANSSTVNDTTTTTSAQNSSGNVLLKRFTAEYKNRCCGKMCL